MSLYLRKVFGSIVCSDVMYGKAVYSCVEVYCMVSVFFGDDKEAILDVDLYFNNVFLDEWLDDPFVREMIEGIDRSKVLSRYCIQSPILGQIPPERLSGGVKTCIMLWKMDDFFTDLMVCGENCQKWLAEIFKRKDARVCMTSYDLSFEGYEIHGICENDGSVINNSADWKKKMLGMVGEGYER